MTPVEHTSGDLGVDRRVGTLMAFVSATLVAGAFIHLAGFTPGGTEPPFNATHAGVAEAIIAVVLLYGAITIWRTPRRARTVALAATGFAIAGFLLGLSMTARGGDPADIAYHVAILPVLVTTMIVCWVGRSHPSVEPMLARSTDTSWR